MSAPFSHGYSLEEQGDFFSQAVDKLTRVREEVFNLQSRKAAKALLTTKQLQALESIRMAALYLEEELDAKAVEIEQKESEADNAKNSYRE